MGLLERSLARRIETTGPSIPFLQGLLKLAETSGPEALKEVTLTLPRKTYDKMIQSGAYTPHPRTSGDRRQGDRRRGDRRD